MPVSPTLLTSGSAGAGTPASSASITPPGSQLIEIDVELRASTNILTANNVTVTGCGLTWVQVSEVVINDRMIAVFRAMGASPSTGALSLAYGGTGTVLSWTWATRSWTGVDTSGTNGSGAVGTPGTASTGSGSTLGVTIPGTPATGDVTFAVIMTEDDSLTLTQAAPFLSINHVTGSDTQEMAVWDSGQDQTESWTWTPSTKVAAIIGFIIKAAAGGGATAKAKGVLVARGRRRRRSIGTATIMAALAANVPVRAPTRSIVQTEPARRKKRQGKQTLLRTRVAAAPSVRPHKTLIQVTSHRRRPRHGLTTRLFSPIQVPGPPPPPPSGVVIQLVTLAPTLALGFD